jgi:hypothetical protein
MDAPKSILETEKPKNSLFWIKNPKKPTGAGFFLNPGFFQPWE